MIADYSRTDCLLASPKPSPKPASPYSPGSSHISPLWKTSLTERGREETPDDSARAECMLYDATPIVPRSKNAVAVHGTVFGLINFIVTVPTLISYAAIVFRRKEFSDNGDMPSLTKLFFLSSVVHQFVFTMMSSLPFAIGQVQDVGLIFLSQIATSVLLEATKLGHSYKEAVATVLVACLIATTFTGVGVWLIGRLEISGYVQLLPLPVIGGYLGYIGYFCLAAGASLGTGLTIDGFATWGQLFVWEPALLIKMALSIAFAVVLFIISYKVKNVVVLPGLLVATPIIFFIVLLCAGISVEDARSGGWIPRPDPTPAAGIECFDLYNGLEGIAWVVLPGQVTKVVGLMCVVAFGSVLDVTAIQTEQPNPLDFDGELRMIGVSNVASGLLGGFTGSYIFSQTIFSQRQGVASSLNGWIIVVGEFVLFLVPIDVLQFFPGFYIGGIMAFFGIDIMQDWLVKSYTKVNIQEYLLLLLSFLMVVFLGVIEGCIAGVAASAAVFIIVYSTTPAVELRFDCASTAMRSGHERVALARLGPHIALIELRGYIFFGAAMQVSDQLIRDVRAGDATWAVIDFTHVDGVDSTGARALSTLVRSLRTSGVRFALSGAARHPQLERLLVEHCVLPSKDDIAAGKAIATDNVDAAVAWCERLALRSLNVPLPMAGMRSTMDGVAQLLGEYVAPIDDSGVWRDQQQLQLLQELASRLELQTFSPGEKLFQEGEPCTSWMLLYEGRAVSVPVGEAEKVSRAPSTAIPSNKQIPKSCFVGSWDFEVGSMLCEVDFYLGSVRSYTAKACDKGCRCAVLTRAIAARLERDEPRLAILAQQIALRSVCLLAGATFGLHARLGRKRSRSG